MKLNLLGHQYQQSNFSLRKLTIGLTSVLLGTTFYIATSTHTVKADNAIKTDIATNNQTTKLQNQSDNIQSISDTSNQTEESSINNEKATTASTNVNHDPNNKQEKDDAINNKTKNKIKKDSADKWNGIDVTYDKDTHILNIGGGVITNPKAIADSISYYNQIKEINFTDKLIVYGDAIGLFAKLANLTTINNLNNLDTNNVTNMDYFFAQDVNLTSMDLTKFDTANVNSMNNMFASCRNLSTLDLSSFNTSKVQFMMHMFDSADKLTNLNLTSFNTSNVTDMSYMFNNASSVTTIDLSSFNTSKVQFMMHMFDSAKSLTKLDLHNFNTSNVTDMSYMFNNTTNLNQVNLTSFDTSNVIYFMHMFDGASQLNKIDLSNFTTPKAIDLSFLFNNCSQLTAVNLGRFDLSNVQYINNMFSNCGNLVKLNTNNLINNNAVSIANMFSNCTSLKKLDLNQFTTKNAYYIANMFNNCNSLTELHIKKFNLAKIVDATDMLANLPQLAILELGSDIDLTNTGLNTPVNWLRVANGTITNPKGTLLMSSADLVKYYHGNTDADTYVRSNAIAHQLEIKYYDLDSNQLLLTESRPYITGTATRYHDQLNDNITKFKNLEYLFDSNDCLLPLDSNQDIFITNPNKADSYTIGLRHHKIRYQHGENNPITNQNDDANLLKQVKRTIKYLGAPQTISDYTQVVQFSRTGLADLVTKNVAYSSWDKLSDTFKEVKSPTIIGYSASEDVVKKQQVTPIDNDILKEVVYTKIPVNKSIITFIDQDNDNLPISNIANLEFNSEIGKPICKPAELASILNKLSDLGYEISIDPFATETIATNGNQELAYIMKHKRQTITQEKEWKQTINFIDQNNSILAKSNIQTIKMHRTGMMDLVTHKYIDNSNWLFKNTLKPVNVPIVKGYLAILKIVKPSVINTDNDSVINITYTKLGKFIPINVTGTLIDTQSDLVYQNDPEDPTQINQIQILPNIRGYLKPNVPVISNPFIDTKVIYQADTNNEDDSQSIHHPNTNEDNTSTSNSEDNHLIDRPTSSSNDSNAKPNSHHLTYPGTLEKPVPPAIAYNSNRSQSKHTNLPIVNAKTNLKQHRLPQTGNNKMSFMAFITGLFSIIVAVTGIVHIKHRKKL